VIPPDAVGLVEVPDEVVQHDPQFVNEVDKIAPVEAREQLAPQSASQLVEVDGSSLSETIRAAHRMGLQVRHCFSLAMFSHVLLLRESLKTSSTTQ